jgi:hypothetical protein
VSEQAFVTSTLSSWKSILERANKLFSGSTEEQLQQEVAPGKNRLIYLWGHLTAVHDRMLPLLGVGERLHPELDDIFLTSPDRAVAELPSVATLKQNWDEVNSKLVTGMERFAPDDWLQRHSSVSEEDFAKDPQRNRLSVLLSRMNHISFHLGQTVLIKK